MQVPVVEVLPTVRPALMRMASASPVDWSTIRGTVTARGGGLPMVEPGGGVGTSDRSAPHSEVQGVHDSNALVAVWRRYQIALAWSTPNSSMRPVPPSRAVSWVIRACGTATG